MDSYAGLSSTRLWLLLVLFAVACCASTSAFAYGSVAPSEQPVYECGGAGLSAPLPRGPSAIAACQAAAVRAAAAFPKTEPCGFFGDGTRSVTYAFAIVDGAMRLRKTTGTCSADQSPGDASGGYFLDPNYLGLVKSCPENSQIVGGEPPTNCECMLNFKPVGGQCVRYDCPAKGSYSQQVAPDVKLPNAGESYCNGGCMVTPSQWKVDQEGQVWGVWPFKSANQACGGKVDAGGATTGEDSPPPAPVACPANQCPGSINGTSVCVPCRSTSTQGPSTSASGAQPGDAPADPSDPLTAVKGSTEQTVCVGAICTTVTKYFDGRGNEVGSKTDEMSEQDYCAKNPMATQCKKGSFGGACGAGFQCEGDAVQCALAKEVHQRNCQWFQDPPQAMKDAGATALAGGDHPAWHPYSNADSQTVSLSALLNTSNPMGNGCPSDRVVVVNGSSYLLPMSQLCPHLELVGKCVVAMCMVVAAGIVFRKGE